MLRYLCENTFLEEFFNLTDPRQAVDRAQSMICDLSGKTAVVTGAGGGIGRATALELARAGADLVIHTGSRSHRLAALAEQLRQSKRNIHSVVADLRHQGTHQSFVDEAWSFQGSVDVWVNLAGADVLTGEAADLSFEQKLAALWNVDVLATIGLSRLAGSRMAGQTTPTGSACIINIGWDQTQCGMEGDSGEMFSAVKGAVTAFTRSLAKSLAPQVRVNCLAPGWIRTRWGQQASEYWQERAQNESLLNRWGTPEDVAQAACFLASPAANFMTGQTLNINGGFRHAISNQGTGGA
jgi:3-oxoacyl-[acyl-carrier protein] reductase